MQILHKLTSTHAQKAPRTLNILKFSSLRIFLQFFPIAQHGVSWSTWWSVRRAGT